MQSKYKEVLKNLSWSELSALYTLAVICQRVKLVEQWMQEWMQESKTHYSSQKHRRARCVLAADDSI